MKKHISILFVLNIITIISLAQDISWYKWLTGSIDKYPITMHLHKAGHQFMGYYYYNKTKEPIYFSGTDTTTKGFIELNASGDRANQDVEKFVFTISGKAAKGTWQKNEQAKKMQFAAEEQKDSTMINFTVVFTSGEHKLRPLLKESPVYGYYASSVWPVGNSISEDFIKDAIREMYSTKQKIDIGAFFLEDKKRAFDQYKEDFKDDDEKVIKENPFPYNYESITDLIIMYQSKQFITLGSSGYFYTGGAHGNHGTSYAVLDLLQKKKMTLQDILTTDGINALPKILEEQFRMDNDLMQTDSLQEAGLFENKIEPNNNFYITPNGLGFQYNPYEIGPYSMGDIDIFIPFIDLKRYVQKGFKEYYKINL